MEINSHKYFKNKKCQYFPCHKKKDDSYFNCLFCYCPMYFIRCPGNFSILDDGRKDCSKCTLPHDPGGWEIVQKVMKNPKPFNFKKNDKSI